MQSAEDSDWMAMAATPTSSGPGPPTAPSATNISSYADRAKMNVRFDQRLRRNVLDIEVEKKDVADEMFLNQDVVAKLLKNIGMNIESEVEGYQVTYGGRSGKIAVLCKTGVNIEKYCRQECYEVCKGVMTKNIRPSGRKDVTVTISGLDFNTPDTLVQEYIAKFGGVLVSNSVIYAKHGEGPFKGKLNGDRKYQVDMTSTQTQMGTYHYLDGERVRVYYRGNAKTCGRCHLTAQQCKGGGIARECQTEGGPRKDLIQHMKELWLEIGFSPTNFKLPDRETEGESDENFGGDRTVLSVPSFTRTPHPTSLELNKDSIFTKTKVTNFPKDISETNAVNFLKENVDKSISLHDLEILRTEVNSQIIIGPGPSKEVVLKAVESLDYHRSQKFFFQDRKLYAKPLKPLTPTKPTNQQNNRISNNKVKAAVEDLEGKDDVKLPPRPVKTPVSQAKKASATTPTIVRHKVSGLTAGLTKK